MQYTELVSVIIVYILVSFMVCFAMHKNFYSQQTLAYTLSQIWTLILSQISSDPTRVCLCENETLNCSITSRSETHYPGEEFTMSAIDVGDINGPVDGPVFAQFLPQYKEGVLGGLQYSPGSES